MQQQIAYKRILIYVLAGISVVFYAWLFILKIRYSTFALGGIIIVSCALIASFSNFRFLYKLLFLVLPFSVEIPLGLGGSKLLFPSEALALIMGISFVFGLFFVFSISRRFISHPVTLSILAYVTVLMVTSLTSQMKIVSVKYTLINLLYICVYYFLVHIYLKKKVNRGLKLYWLYGISIFFIILYALYNQSQYHFEKFADNIAVNPFFSDHAIYSACIAMLFPVFLAFSFIGRKLNLNATQRIMALLITTVFAAGIFFSYSRAAWVSLAAAMVIYACLLVKIRPAYFLVMVCLVGLVAYAQKDNLIEKSKLNHYSSTENNPSLEDETKSITNITNDVSNAERLNRWSCAWRMFLDKPFTGFGPGTYQFQYLLYQLPDEMTRISVISAYNNPPGKGGSAHSEYLLALSESGIFGFLSLSSVFLLSVLYGMRGYYRARTIEDKILIAIALTSIVTYMAHVFFNNYLNVDKTAGLFWFGISMLVNADIQVKNKESALSEKPVNHD